MENLKFLITGNKTFGLAKELNQIFNNTTFVSRETGYDLTIVEDQNKLSKLVLEYDVFINSSALWKFNQTILLDKIYKSCIDSNHNLHIICIGSTTDRVKNSKVWLYNAEKKALRDYCNTLSLSGVWGTTPKVTYISFGTLSNNQKKHPDRKCLDIKLAAEYVKWVVNQPKFLNINEISIDPMQGKKWHE